MRRISIAVARKSIPVGVVTRLRRCSDHSKHAHETLSPAQAEVFARLQQNPTDGTIWNDLAMLLPAGDMVPHPKTGERLSRSDCLRYAADLAYDNGTVWSNIGTCLGPGETVDVRDASITAIGCHLRAVRLDNTSGTSWLNLAFAMQEGQSFALPEFDKVGRLEALSIAAACFERDLAAGKNDGNGELDTRSMLAGCYAMAAGAMLAGHAAHSFSGEAPRTRHFEVPAGTGTQRTPMGCLQRALEVAGNEPTILQMAVNMMGPSESFTVNGKPLARRDILVTLIDADPDNADTWAGLSEEVGDGTVRVGDVEYSRLQLLQQALQKDVTCAPAWKELARYCATRKGDVSIGSAKYDTLACFSRALLYDPTDAHMWDAAARQMEQEQRERLSVGNVSCTVQECKQMAIAQRGMGEIPDVFTRNRRA
jgi:hypothetical protein